jgi:hypothetical protein
MRFRLALVLPLALATLAAVSCGPGAGAMDAGMNGTLPEEGPFVARAEGRVRTVVVTRGQAQPQAMEAASCMLQGWLFDTAAPRALDVLGSEGECRLYSGSSSLALEMQRWICAGAITVSAGGVDERLSLCPELTPVGATGAQVPLGNCGMFAGGTTVRISSGSEIDNDVLADLDVMLTLPDAVTITQPTNLGVFTWPEAGPLEVRWSSANATSAVVTLQVRNPMGPAPLLVCLPRTNGQVTVPSSLLQQGNFRTQDVLVRVASYRDARVMAEGGAVPYRVAAGFSAALLLQARR